MNFFPRARCVVPIDFSERSRKALEVAEQLVADRSHLYLVHVLSRAPDFDPTMPNDPERDVRRQQTALAFMQRRYSDGDSDVNLTVRIGRQGREIAAFAEEIGADLLVMSSRGLTGLDHERMGSVAEVVIRFAHCPVLVLRE